MSAALLLLFYCLAIAAASVAGGLLPGLVRMTHTRTQLIMSFVSGLVLGVACYHMLPHSIVRIGGPHAADVAAWWLMLGLVLMFLLLRLFHFHQHDFSAAGDHVALHEGRRASAPLNSLSWGGVALGLALHTLIDGIALGAVIYGEAQDHGAAGLLGLGVFLAILLHKPLDALSITTMMAAGGRSRRARLRVNLAFAAMCPLGALLFYFGVDLFGALRYHIVGAALAFSAGTFICIALSDLLPEVQFHSHDRIKLAALFLLGIALAYSLALVEPADAHRVVAAAATAG